MDPLTGRKLDMLQFLAEHRLMTVLQIMTSLATSNAMVRRYGGQLADAGLVACGSRGLGRSPGRPEKVYSLTIEGVNALKSAERLPVDVAPDHAMGEGLLREIDHQLLLNWCAIFCQQLPASNPALSVTFLSSKSPYHRGESGGSLLTEHIAMPDGESVGFLPDAVFVVTHAELKKSLLFFVEVDMGTEVAANPARASRKDLRTKILLYRKYLGSKGYKRYERRFGAELNGFRMLLVSNTASGKETLCRLVQEMRPCDFIWVTDQDAMFKAGVGGPIWARGGNGEARRSILGGDSGKTT